jgi:hypothetical protein
MDSVMQAARGLLRSQGRNVDALGNDDVRTIMRDLGWAPLGAVAPSGADSGLRPAAPAAPAAPDAPDLETLACTKPINFIVNAAPLIQQTPFRPEDLKAVDLSALSPINLYTLFAMFQAGKSSPATMHQARTSFIIKSAVPSQANPRRSCTWR